MVVSKKYNLPGQAANGPIQSVNHSDSSRSILTYTKLAFEPLLASVLNDYWLA